ncbi:unnamed protein product [Darwinula stevensoni]|uniref:glutathione transferase n=1 Tax=Darwinula stevensoni TaxID=69355 RepID=A0A7R8X910_9CRUS|nr:unnamed protein product [Darwinula stevensoni]CAG0890649.1 unnamed protein product [Darwinula stevensoni]
MAPVIGYWRPRGLLHPIRMLLVHTGVDFEDKVYPETSRDEWLKDKESLGLPMPNLPYYIDGDCKLTQSLAIIRYLARKHGLAGTNEEELIRTDLVECQVQDLRLALIKLGYHEYSEEAREKYLKETLANHLKLLSGYLGDHPWVAGNKMTYVDFLLHDTLDWHLFLDPTCLDGYQNLKDFLARFESQPNIKAFMESEKFLKWPIFGPMSKWGYDDAGSKLRFPD